MTGALLLISFAFFFSKGSEASSGFAVFGLALYLSFFSVGMGPGAWLVPSEIFAASIRAKAMSVATFSNRIVATLMASTFLSTAKAIGWAGFFLMLASICIIVGCFLYFYLPETKGRSLEDMSVYFAEITNDTSLLEAEAKIIRMREEKARGRVEMTSRSQQAGGGEGTMT
jgi:MFS family permease